MKQITNKEYEEWQKYKAEKATGHILLPDTVRLICEANGYDVEKIGQHFLEICRRSVRLKRNSILRNSYRDDYAGRNVHFSLV